MIQRVQSLLLLLAALINLAGLFLPLWSAGAEGHAMEVAGMRLHHSEAEVMFFDHANSTQLIAHTGYVALTAVAAIWLLLVIFQFRNRNKQVRQTYLGMLLLCLEILALVWLTLQLPAEPAGPEWGALTPVVALVLTWLAARQIRKDEELVRSVDRIR